MKGVRSGVERRRGRGLKPRDPGRRDDAGKSPSGTAFTTPTRSYGNQCEIERTRSAASAMAVITLPPFSGSASTNLASIRASAHLSSHSLRMCAGDADAGARDVRSGTCTSVSVSPRSFCRISEKASSSAFMLTREPSTAHARFKDSPTCARVNAKSSSKLSLFVDIAAARGAGWGGAVGARRMTEC